MYGTNEIIIPQRSLLALLFMEVLHPFFVFQFFSFVIWCLDEYVLYGSAILIMTVISAIGSGLSTYFVSVYSLLENFRKRISGNDIRLCFYRTSVNYIKECAPAMLFT